MATSTSASQLYGAVAQLAFAESKLAVTPLLPFIPADAPHLLTQSNTIIGQGVAIHGRDPATMVQSAVDDAILHVQAAQKMIDIVNTSPGTTLSGVTIFSTVDSAITSVGAV
jgi:hypothetical protein